MVPIWVLALIKFSVSLHINIEVISTWILCLQNFGLKNILWIVRIHASTKAHFFLERRISVIVHLPFPWHILSWHDRTWFLKTVFPRIPCQLDFGEILSGKSLWETGSLAKGGSGWVGETKDIVTFSLLWVSSLVMWLFVLRGPSLDQAAWLLALVTPYPPWNPFCSGSSSFANLRSASLSHTCKLFHKFRTWASF